MLKKTESTPKDITFNNEEHNVVFPKNISINDEFFEQRLNLVRKFIEHHIWANSLIGSVSRVSFNINGGGVPEDHLYAINITMDIRDADGNIVNSERFSILSKDEELLKKWTRGLVNRIEELAEKYKIKVEIQ